MSIVFGRRSSDVRLVRTALKEVNTKDSNNTTNQQPQTNVDSKSSDNNVNIVNITKYTTAKMVDIKTAVPAVQRKVNRIEKSVDDIPSTPSTIRVSVASGDYASAPGTPLPTNIVQDWEEGYKDGNRTPPSETLILTQEEATVESVLSSGGAGTWNGSSNGSNGNIDTPTLVANTNTTSMQYVEKIVKVPVPFEVIVEKVITVPVSYDPLRNCQTPIPVPVELLLRHNLTIPCCSHQKCSAPVLRCPMHTCPGCGGDKRHNQRICSTCPQSAIPQIGQHPSHPSSVNPNANANNKAVILLPRIPEASIRRIKLIGKGSNSSAFQCMYDGMMACEKVLHSEQGPAVAVEEACVMAKCDRHPNVLRLYGVCQRQDGTLAIIMELMESDLLQRLALYRELPLVERAMVLPQLTSYLLQISHAVRHLHRNGIIHRDLAARNVLMDKEVVKLADFGLAMTVGNREPTNLPKPLSTAPEAIRDLENPAIWTEKCDSWSFGLLIMEVLSCGEDPLEEFNNSVPAFLSALDQGWLPKRSPLCSDAMWSIVLACLNNEPNHRPTFEQISTALNVLLSQPQRLQQRNKRMPSPSPELNSDVILMSTAYF